MLSGVGSRLAGAASLAGLVLLAAACGGGGAATAKAADSSTTVTPSSSSVGQQQTMSDYLQCLKDHGITVPTDANGNPTFGPRGANGANGSSGADTSTPPDSSGTPPSSFDRNGFQQARQACGTPPGRAGGAGGTGGAPADPQAAQQAALLFAACLRAQGLNVPDPDFSTTTTTPPTSAGTANGNGGGFRRGGGAIGAIMRNLDQNDPTVQAALQKCQADFPGRNGQGGATTTAPTTG
jgi:hypothetical protein